MKEKETYKNIEELFSDKLTGRELPVSDKFWKGFERKLRFREFMRFNPSGFNIYYLAGAIAAAVTLTVSVISNKDKEVIQPQNDPPVIYDTTEATVQDTVPGIISLTIDPAEEPVEKEAVEEKSEINAEPVERHEKKDVINVPDTTVIKNETVIAAKPIKLDTKIAVESAPVARFSTNITKGCAPLTISFNNLSLNYDSCIWEFDDGGLSTDNNPVWVFDEPGEYEVNLILFGRNGDRVVTSETVTVYPGPVARFEVSAGDPYIPDEQIRFYNYSQNGIRWEWDLGDGTISKEFEPSHFYEKPGSYTVKLKAISEHGCLDSMILTNAFARNSCFIEFPNAFIPNDGGPTGGYYSNRSDQQEEVFHPVFSGVTAYNLKIYSRRGILVFETDDIEIGWDGYYKGQKAEPGVYIWKVRGMFKTGDPFVKGGDVTVLPKW